MSDTHETRETDTSNMEDNNMTQMMEEMSPEELRAQLQLANTKLAEAQETVLQSDAKATELMKRTEDIK